MFKVISVYNVSSSGSVLLVQVTRAYLCSSEHSTKVHNYTSAEVNFINMLMHSFYTFRSQKHKKLLDLTVFLALLGSARLKAGLTMLVKLTIGIVKAE